MKYTKEQFLLAAEIGEVSMIDARYVVSLLDEAVAMQRQGELRQSTVLDCKCIRFAGGSKWFPNGCKVHPGG